MKEVNKRDSNYDNTIIDINKLPINTEFCICNGTWKGTILQNDTSKYINMENCRPIKLNKNHPYLLNISNININNEVVNNIII